MPRKHDDADKIDLQIAGRVQSVRLAAGFSTMQLAAKIGVSHQQIRKYELGQNRLSAGRLAQIATTFNKSIAFFYGENEELITQDYTQRSCLELLRNFMKIEDPRSQGAVSSITRILARM